MRFIRNLPWKYLFLLLIPLLLYLALKDIRLAALQRTIGQLRAWQIFALLLINLIVIAHFGVRLGVLLRSEGSRIGLLRLIRYWLAGFSFSYFMPGPQLGGGSVELYFLHKRDEVPLSTAAAAVASSKLLERMGNAIFLLLGLFIIARFEWLPASSENLILITGALLLIIPTVYFLLLYTGHQPLNTFVTRIEERQMSEGFPGQVLRGVATSELRLSHDTRERPGLLALALTITLLSWVAVIFETWTALRFLGVKLAIDEIVALLATVQIAFLGPFPAGLGLVEAGVVFSIRRLGQPPEVGVTLALLVRGRDTLFGSLGLLLGGRSAWRALSKRVNQEKATMPPPMDQKSSGTEDITGRRGGPQRFYDRIAVIYDAWMRLNAWFRGIDEDRQRRKLLHRMDLESSERFLEVACGTGSNLVHAADSMSEGALAVGVDLSDEMLGRALEKMRIRGKQIALVQARASALPFREHAYDRVLNFGGLRVLPDIERALSEVLRVARENAWIALGDAWESEIDDDLWRYMGRLISDRKSESGPNAFLPESARQVHRERIWGGQMLLLRFRNTQTMKELIMD